MAGDARTTNTIESLIASGAILAHKDGNYGSSYPRIEEFGSNGVPFLTAKSLRDGHVDIASAPRLADARANELRFGFVEPDDVLLSHNATIGRVAVVPQHKGRLLVGTSLTYFRLNPQKLLPRYLAVYLAGVDFQNQLVAVMSHSTRNQVPVTAQRKLHVVVPSLAEQKAIAAVLGALDDKIESNRRMNGTLEAMARALFQSWFVDFDPVRAKLDGRLPSGLDPATAALFPTSFQQSEIAHIPEGWTVGKIADLATLSRDAVNPADFPTETFDHFSLPAFDAGRTPKVELGIAIMSNKLVVTPNSVLLSKLNPHIPRIWLPDLHPTRRSLCSTEFMVACSKRDVTREYLFSLFTSSAFTSVYGTLVTGTTGSHQRIRSESVLEMQVIIPPPPLIQAFTAIAKPMFDQINRNTEQSRTLATLRDTLLPKLLSGKLSINAAI